MSATVTARGQITLPKRIRDALRLETGSRVDFVVEADGSVRLVKLGGARAFIGFAKGDMSTDQIMALLRGDD